MKRRILLAAAALAIAPSAFAAPDWSKVPKKTITVFYPGTASIEWIQVGTQHGGARAVRRGETCASCHDEETADMGKKMVSGQKLEPDPASVKGKAASIPVTVQAAYDATNLYMRLQWKQPPSSGIKKMDDDNAVKVGVMLDDNKVELGAVGACWASCHHDLRTMPDVSAEARRHPRAKELDIRSNGPTKYLRETRTAIELRSSPLGGWDKLKPEAEYAQMLEEGRFLELWQYRSTESPRAGHVLEARRLKAAPGRAEGRNEGGNWTVTFTRPLAGDTGRHALTPGKSYNFGFAIHDDHSDGRYHHVSLGYTLGLDDAKATVNAVRQ